MKQTRKHRESGASVLRAALSRRRSLAVAAFCLPLSAIVGLAVFLPRLYRSTAVVLVEAPIVPEASGDDVEVALQRLTKENLGRERLLTLVDAFDLRPDLRRVGPDATVAAVRRDVAIETDGVDKPGGRASIALSITFLGSDRTSVAGVANALAAFYEERDRDRLREETRAVDAELREAEARVEEIERTHLHGLFSSLSELRAKLDATREERARTREREHALARRLEPAGRAATPADPGVDPTKAELDRLRGVELALRARYTEAHPDVVQVHRQILALEARMDRTAPAAAVSASSPDDEASLGRVRSDLRGLAADEKRLSDQIAGVQTAALDAPRRAEELAAVMPRYEAARRAYESLLRRSEDLRLSQGESGERGLFRVVEKAVPAPAPSVPSPLHLSVVGILLSLLVCAVSVAVAEQVDGSFHTRDDLRAFARVPLLGTIPRISTPSDTRWSYARSALRLLALAAAIALVLVAVRHVASGSESLVRMFVRRGP